MKITLLLTSFAFIAFTTHGQATFQNLDFESATISPSQSLGVINSADALPGWNVYFGASGPQPQIDSGVMIVGNPSPWVVLFGTHNFGDGSAIEGNFSVYLAGQLFETPGEPDSPAGSISQTGLVPADAQSILFKAQPGSASFTLSLDGENIPYTSLATEPNYTLYAADVTAFAGQVSDLAFTAGIYGN